MEVNWRGTWMPIAGVLAVHRRCTAGAPVTRYRHSVRSLCTLTPHRHSKPVWPSPIPIDSRIEA